MKQHIQSPFLLACQRKKTPITPVWYMRQAGRIFPEYLKLRQTYNILTLAQTPELAARVALMPVQQIHVDAAILFADIMLPLIAAGVKLDIVDSVGPVIAHPITKEKDIDALQPIDPANDMTYIGKTITAIKQELPKTVPLIGFSGAPFTLASYLLEGKPTRDFIKTKTFMYTQPTAWQQLMKKLTTMIIDYLRYQVQQGADVIQLFDSWVGCLSAADFDTYVLPYSQTIFEAVHATGVPGIHFGTNTAAFLPAFSSVPCDVVSVDWRLPIDQAWKQIGKTKAIQGNVDPVILLANWDVIRSRVDTLLDALPTRTGYIFNLGHGVLPGTSLQTLIRLTDYVHQKT